MMWVLHILAIFLFPLALFVTIPAHLMLGKGTSKYSSFSLYKAPKKCKYCAEEIQADAIVCKHCGRDV